MNILDEIRTSWGWIGINPEEVIDENDFGNLIVKDTSGKVWRICPEEVYCKIIADKIDSYKSLKIDPEFSDDWLMEDIISDAKNRLGPLKPGYKYYLVIPGVLGGDYYGENVQSVPFYEVIRVSGDFGFQLKDLPEGAKVDLKVVR